MLVDLKIDTQATSYYPPNVGCICDWCATRVRLYAVDPNLSFSMFQARHNWVPLTRDNVTYHFCSRRCRFKFEQNAPEMKEKIEKKYILEETEI